MIKKIELAILLMFFMININAITVRQSIMMLAEEVSADGIYYGEHIGITGSPPPEINQYLNMRDQATEDELIALVDNPNPVLRCYAFKALVYKNYDRAFNLVLSRLDDVETVNVLFFDVGGSVKVSDLLLDNFHYIFTDSTKKSENDVTKNISIQQRKQLEIALINNPNAKISARSNLLSCIETLPQYYERIKVIALEDHDPGAIMWLGRNQNAQDIKIINDFLKSQNNTISALEAVQFFPDEYFLPTIIGLFDQEWSKKLYDYVLWRNIIVAMAKYQDINVEKRFELIVESKDIFRRETLGADLFIGIKKSNNSYYDKFLSRIVLSDFQKAQTEIFLK